MSAFELETQPGRVGVCKAPYDCDTNSGLLTHNTRESQQAQTRGEQGLTDRPGNSGSAHQRQGHSDNPHTPQSSKSSNDVEAARGRRKRSITDIISIPPARKRNRSSSTDLLDRIGRQSQITRIRSALSSILEKDGLTVESTDAEGPTTLGRNRLTWTEEDNNLLNVCIRRGAYRTAANTIRFKPDEILELFCANSDSSRYPSKQRTANGIMARWQRIRHKYPPINVSILPLYRKGQRTAWNADEMEIVEEIAKLKVEGEIPNDDIGVQIFRTMLTESTKSWQAIRARLDVKMREIRYATQMSANPDSTSNNHLNNAGTSKRSWHTSDSQEEDLTTKRPRYNTPSQPAEEQAYTPNGTKSTPNNELVNTGNDGTSEENKGEQPESIPSREGTKNKVERERYRDRGPRNGYPQGGTLREEPPQEITIPDAVDSKYENYLKYIKGTTKKKLPIPSYPPCKRELAIINKLIGKSDPQNLEAVSDSLYCAALAVLEQRQKPTITSELTKTKNYIETLKGRLKTARQSLGNTQATINYMNKNGLTTIEYYNPTEGQITRTKRRYEVRKTQKLEAIRALQHSIKIANAKADKLQNECQQITKSEPAEEQPQKLKMPSVEKYFKNLLGLEAPYNREDPQLKQWFEKRSSAANHENVTISQPIWEDCIKKIKPWKAPGPDGIQAFYWKAVPVAKQKLLEAANQYLNAQTTPNWLCKGRTVLIYKGKGAEEQPANYRPITCLNTAYKLITAAVCKIINPYIEAHWNPQQRAMSKGMQGTCHALLTDRIIQEYHKAKDLTLSVAWFDYKKAFDSTPHRLILDCLERVGVPNNVQTWLKNTMENWETVFQLRRGKKTINSVPIKFKRGVYQGDSLSPLLFCLSLIPLQDILDEETEGINLVSKEDRVKITHQLYMDDLKIYAPNDEALNKAINIVSEVSQKTGMSLGINKCAQDHYKGPKIGRELNKLIPRLGREETYTYLGIKQKVLSDDSLNIRELTEDICTKAKNIFSNGQPWRMKVQTFNWRIPPKVRYLTMASYAGLCATEDGSCKFNNMDGRIRGILVATGHRQKTCSKERLYLPSQDGGLHIKSLKDTYYESTIARKIYCESKISDITRLVNIAKANELAIKFIKTQDLYYGGIVQLNVLHSTVESPSIKLIKETHKKHMINERWGRMDVLKQASTLYREEHRHVLPSIGAMFYKGFIQTHQLKVIVAAQELQAVVLTHASRNNTNPGCPFCETPLKNPINELKHLLGSCSQNRGLIEHRHDGVAIQVHHMIERYTMGNHSAEIRFDVFPKPVIKHGHYTLKWDHLYSGMPRNSHRRPDIVLEDHSKKRIYIIEIGVCSFESLKERTEGKHGRYKIGHDIFDQEKDLVARESLADNLSKSTGYLVEVIPIIVGYWGELLPRKERLNWHLLAKLVGKKQAGMLELKISCQAAIQSEKILSKYLSYLPNANRQ